VLWHRFNSTCMYSFALVADERWVQRTRQHTHGEQTVEEHVLFAHANKYSHRQITRVHSHEQTHTDKTSFHNTLLLPPTCSAKAVVFGGEVSQSDRGHEGAGDFEGDTLVVDSKGVVASASDPSDGNASPPARGWAACDVDGSVFVLSGGLAGNDESPVRLADVWVGTM
jgi:hypothetical protein